ncbi:MAG TPA: hypothetical protein VFB38_20440 [Chthonomonadaceae bacterium]|jgi:hypothetical protein|nr:hypothetical protein [Chthonomonadaceae bacterium]
MPGFDWDAELPEAERDQLIERLAQQVARRRLHGPAVLLLEMHKPLTFLASQSLLLGSGFLAPLFGPQNIQRYSKLLESRENIERLIRRIEELAT